MKDKDLKHKSKDALLKIINQLQDAQLSLDHENSNLTQEKLNPLEENRLLREKIFGPSSEKIADFDQQKEKEKLFNETEINTSEEVDNPDNEDFIDNLLDSTDETGVDVNNNAIAPKKKNKPPKKPFPKTYQEGVFILPLPNFYLPKSIAETGLIAQTAINNYARHLPLQRQENIWKSLGVTLPRGTICNWLMNAYEVCMPLVAIMKAHLIKQLHLQADETPVQVLNEELRKDTQKSYMWVYQSMTKDKRFVLFDYQKTRSDDNPKDMLLGFSDFLQTDTYKAYDWVNSLATIYHLGCMAHARCPFVEIAKSTKKRGKSHQAIAFFKKLYNIEKVANENNLSPQNRKELRLKE